MSVMIGFLYYSQGSIISVMLVAQIVVFCVINKLIKLTKNLEVIKELISEKRKINLNFIMDSKL